MANAYFTPHAVAFITCNLFGAPELRIAFRTIKVQTIRKMALKRAIRTQETLLFGEKKRRSGVVEGR